jgi:hypothetical protein
MNRPINFLWLDWIIQTILLIILTMVATEAPVEFAVYSLLLLSWQLVRTFLSLGFLIYYLVRSARTHRGGFLPHTSF